MPAASLVLTTINNPVLLNEYCDNFRKFGHLQDVSVTLIPDRKTPASAFETCKLLAAKGMRIRVMDLAEQDEYLKKVGFPPQRIPYNSDNRRNVGYLAAFEERTDFLISIDDDNYVRPEEDFFSEHARVLAGESQETQCDSDNGWYNICTLFETEPAGSMTYARGFPYFARHAAPRIIESKVRRGVAVNAGLWLGDPDVDGISWLVNPVHSKSWKGSSILLGPRTWSPINTQNTALRREATAAYYFLKMGYPLGGAAIDRYGDIFSGYYLEACAHHLGHGMRFGSPCARHIRNSHNYLKDAQQEMYCIVVLEDLLAWMHDVKLDGSTYAEAYESLSFQIEDAVESFTSFGWSDSVRGYFHQMGHYMRSWIKACRTIGL